MSKAKTKVVYEGLKAHEEIQQDVITMLPSLLNKTDKDIGVIFVVGAHYGLEIDGFLITCPNCVVYAFEAHPKHYNTLADRFKSQHSVHCFNNIVLDREGDVMFHELGTPGNGSVLRFKEDGCNKIVDSFPVVAIRLDKFMDSHSINKNIDLLWVDVQGAELSVLKAVDLRNVESLFLEVNEHLELYEGNCYLTELEKYLEPTHYLQAIGLDHETNNGTGNSFWLKRN